MTPHPLRSRRFQLLFAARSLSLLGDAVVPVALAIAVWEATRSSAALALLLVCAMAPRLLLLPVGGVVGDRLNARTIAAATAVVRAAAQLFVGVQLLGGDPQLWQLAVAEGVGGVATAFAMPAFAPLVTGTVAAEQRQQANAAIGAATSAARLGGPPLAGLLLFAGAGEAFIAVGLGFAVSAVLMAAITVPHVVQDRRPFLADLRQGWSEVRSRDWYWSSLIAHSVWNGAAAVFATLGPAVAMEDLGGKAAWVAITTAGGIGLLLGSLLAGRARPRRPVLTGNLGLAAYAIPLALLALPAPAPVVVAGYGIAQAGLGFLNPVWQTTVQDAIPANVLARVTSYDWLLSLAAMPLGYALAPLAADAWGRGAPLTVSAALVAAACLGTALVPGVRRFTAVTPGSAAPRQEPAPVSSQ
ncbi:MFS transporter [Streptomyces boninensis]|uniref:MFS transporter n=1 Tax=Streptomyces boninensis TaxID=2039455 RepID=UPI003B2229CB